MVFSSLIFLCAFLPVCLLLYFISPTLKSKNWVLLLCSLFFYAWGEPVWVVLLVFSAVVDYINGTIISRYRGHWQAKAALVASLVINLGLLAVFKYLDFFLSGVGLLIGSHIPPTGIALPIGISFYTFQTLSYTIDVYRDKVEVQRSFSKFLLFVSLFPQLIAGPILRYSEIDRQLSDRHTTLEGVWYGITRFTCGLAKKVLLANYAGQTAASVLSGDLHLLPAAEAWLGLLMFAFQIYFDFSGYSDMAIGLGRIFGFDYGENFNLPYTSKSITEFWRRWHISLGSFFRDYVYIPLGGNRRLQIRNLVVVWFLTGLWHGASLNFVLWGLYFCVLLILEKFVLKSLLEKLPAFVRWVYAFFFILLGWALFYFTDLSDLGAMLGALFGGAGTLYSENTRILLTNNLPLLIACALGSSALPRKLKAILQNLNAGAGRRARIKLSAPALNRVAGLTTIAYNLILLLFCFGSLVGSGYNPFLYFRF